MNKSITFLTDKEVGRRSSPARSLAFPESLLWANKSRRPFLSPEKNKTHNDLCHFFNMQLKPPPSLRAFRTLTLMTSPLWKLISSASEAVKEKRATASMLTTGGRKLLPHEWRSSCVIGARRGEGTPSQDDIISALSAWRRSLASRSLVNEESFLSACVSPFYHVTAARSERTRGAADWCLLTQSFDGACPQGKSAQGGRDG